MTNEFYEEYTKLIVFCFFTVEGKRNRKENNKWSASNTQQIKKQYKTMFSLIVIFLEIMSF